MEIRIDIKSIGASKLIALLIYGAHPKKIFSGPYPHLMRASHWVVQQVKSVWGNLVCIPTKSKKLARSPLSPVQAYDCDSLNINYRHHIVTIIVCGLAGYIDGGHQREVSTNRCLPLFGTTVFKIKIIFFCEFRHRVLIMILINPSKHH